MEPPGVTGHGIGPGHDGRGEGHYHLGGDGCTEEGSGLVHRAVQGLDRV